MKDPMYLFEPKEDITAHELAKLLVLIMPSRFRKGEIGELVAALPDNCKRHVRLVDGEANG